MIFIFHDGLSPFIIDVHVLALFIKENISAQTNKFLRKRSVVEGGLRENERHNSIITARCTPMNGIT